MQPDPAAAEAILPWCIAVELRLADAEIVDLRVGL
jgi:hypothetical protein